MNYEKIYNNIIESRRGKGLPEGYKEVHHIIPKSFGGSDDPTNLIALTAKEHFIVHRLLAKMYPASGMVHAIYLMACVNKTNKKYKVTSRLYEQLRIQHAIRVSNDESAKRKKSLSSKGKKQSKEHVIARTNSRKNKGEWLTEETKKKIGIGNSGKIGPWRGKTLPNEMVQKRNESRKKNGNYKWSEERKQKQSDRLKGRKSNKRPLTDDEKQKLREEKTKQVTCPHCGKQGTVLIMPRWHFDNCKLKS